MKHFMPVRLCTGEHSVAENAELFQHCGSRCMIVTGKTSAVKSGALDDVAGVLKRCGIPYRVFDEISQNPSVDSCIRAGRAAGDFGADFVVGIGGGSALDAAKAAAVFAANGSLDENGFYAKNWDADPLPILLVGTTAGTGSEVTKVSVLTDSKGRKHSIHDDRLFAAAAFGDARYTMALPQPVTLSTGIDVLSHCAESWFNRKADEVSRAFAVRGIRLLYEPLLAAAEGRALRRRGSAGYFCVVEYAGGDSLLLLWLPKEPQRSVRPGSGSPESRPGRPPGPGKSGAGGKGGGGEGCGKRPCCSWFPPACRNRRSE